MRINVMSVRRVVPNIQSERMDESRKFYTEVLGLKMAMDMGWIMTLVSPSNPTAQLSLLRGPALTTPQAQVTLSIEVDDVDAIHARAVADGIPIVYPLTTEPWGVRRFHVADPNGVVINVMSHQK
jgi:predicted enzyme related to lactoylglutathione lyase